jgi:hypothetical protein
MSTISAIEETIKLNKKKYQNSDRDARPEKSAYFRKQVATASVKLRDGGGTNTSETIASDSIGRPHLMQLGAVSEISV